MLKGARFSLYQVDLDASIAQGKVVAKLDDGCGDNPAYSSDSGVVTFGTSEHPLESSVLYYFVEDSAPAGYEVTNTDPTYVMFCGTGEQAEKDYREAFAKANSLGIKPSAGAPFSVFDKKSDTDVTEPSAVTPTAPHDERHMPQTGDTLGGVRLAVVLVAAAGVAFVALGLAGARRRMRR